MRVGILGIGLHLPPDVRTNAWWAPELVAQWMARRAAAPPPQPPQPETEGIRRVVAAMKQQHADPFQGTVHRHIASDTTSAVDLEEHAARAALAEAGVQPGEIDLLLSYTLAPDYLMSNPGCIVHERLGLAKHCTTLQVDAAANSFLGQLALAESMILAGKARYALLLQSSIGSRLIDQRDPGSVLVGDGATAAVIGRVNDDLGVEASIQLTDGRFPKTLIAAVPTARWYDPGHARMHVADWRQMNDVFFMTADVCKESVDLALARAGRTPGDVDFLCVYQGTPWLRAVVQEYTGLQHARTHETFSTLGYLSAAMIPATLALASRAGSLRDGDLVVMTGGGTGMTYGATVMTWGRG